jgi:hypothetical protein
MKKSNSKFKLAPLKLLTFFENPSSNPTAAILTLKMLQKAACDSVNHTGSRLLRIFPAANERSALENVRPITEKGGGFQ